VPAGWRRSSAPTRWPGETSASTWNWGPAGEGPADPPLVPRRRGARDGGRGGARRSPAGRRDPRPDEARVRGRVPGNLASHPCCPGTRRRGWGTREAPAGESTRCRRSPRESPDPAPACPHAGPALERLPQGRLARRAAVLRHRPPRAETHVVDRYVGALAPLGSRRAAASRGSTRARSSARAPSVCCAAQAGRARG